VPRLALAISITERLRDRTDCTDVKGIETEI
jgi:hypothetical protein